MLNAYVFETGKLVKLYRPVGANEGGASVANEVTRILLGCLVEKLSF
jgi:hypothetical protein